MKYENIKYYLWISSSEKMGIWNKRRKHHKVETHRARASDHGEKRSAARKTIKQHTIFPLELSWKL